MSPHYSDTDAPPPHSGPRRSSAGSQNRGRHDLGGRVMSALSPRPLINHGESFAEPLANPLLSKWLCVLKDAWFVTASHLPVRRCQSIRRGRQPWEILSFLSAPSLRARDLLSPPKPLATPRVRAAQHSRVASAPRGITVATRAVLKLCPTGPAEPFAITFAPPREWLRVKITSLPDGSHREGFNVLSSIQIQQTIYGLYE